MSTIPPQHESSSSTPSSTRTKSLLSEVRQKLITREDPHHIHKVFGILSLVSFVYRYAFLVPKTGSLGFNRSFETWLTLIVHTGLSCSSIIFHVIRARMENRAMIIYEEYRQHAIVFTLRAILVTVFGLYFPEHLPHEVKHVCLVALVAAHHLAADEITRRHGKPGVTAVRVKDQFSSKITLLLRGYSFYQFLALAAHLTPSAHLADLGWNAVIAIQSSAFMMTLYRKNLVTSWTHGAIYSSCLFISACYMVSCFSFEWLAGVLVVFLARTRLGINKYLLWGLYSLFISQLFHHWVEEQRLTASLSHRQLTQIGRAHV